MFFATLLEKTGVLEDILDIMLALAGRFKGGAGYAAVIASGFMATMSGSVSANVAASGSVTIPAMKKAKFSPDMAAGIVVGGSALGSGIPPSTFIIISFAYLNDMFPYTYSFSSFWTFTYYVGGVYFLHRIITVFFIIKKNRIQPMDPEDIPPIRASLKKGWKTLFLPLVVFFPFWFNNTFGETWITSVLGPEGAAAFGGSLIIIVPCVAIAYVFFIAKDRKKNLMPFALVENLKGTTKSLAPIVFMLVGGYAISELFADISIMEMMQADLEGIHIPFWAVAIFLPLVLAIIGCVFDGLATLTLLGPLVLILTSSVGISPWLSAAMMPLVIHSMSQMTPPFSPAIMVAVGIADSDLVKTFKQMLIWITGHYAVTLLFYFGIIPIIGSIR